ncbi:DUF4328 domain-containing protein [Nocardia sp. CDC159]|uniref:DUF4328 domain-containing protein n=1 Tax=Nocardia pulmonis TaxID=2951408 RepID=A0A9X2EAY8_9NOCA|nr:MULTISPECIES: DUF4328 domain-containing protein [Nocardia]MCM6776900.1 DUF4328 domain-containing protein [Nocardia pulmonis]MCM6789324.1 DUF4328 domain-containing protein [Nocardia sp. CDC159]
MSTVVQPCVRCGARWAVRGTPMHWCPRCHGVLLSPAPVDAPPQRRNYRWVARVPGRRPRDGRAPRPPVRRDPTTPRYTEIPRWGLRDAPPRPALAPVNRLAGLTDRVAGLLLTTAVLFGVAAGAELGRYLILLHNRTRLIHPALLLVSDASVFLTAGLAAVFALLSAVAAVGWLARARGAAYARVGRRDPRSLRTLLCGCLIPVANLLWPGVFLTELVDRRGGDPRVLRAVRIWWGVWILNGLMVAAALAWRFARSLQAQADGVMFTVYTDLVAAAVAVLSLWVIRLCEGRDLRGRVRTSKRWLAASGPVAPVIEPVHPVAESAGRASDSVVGKDVGTDAAHASGSEQEEVMAK